MSIKTFIGRLFFDQIISIISRGCKSDSALSLFFVIILGEK